MRFPRTTFEPMASQPGEVAFLASLRSAPDPLVQLTVTDPYAINRMQDRLIDLRLDTLASLILQGPRLPEPSLVREARSALSSRLVGDRDLVEEFPLGPLRTLRITLPPQHFESFGLTFSAIPGYRLLIPLPETGALLEHIFLRVAASAVVDVVAGAVERAVNPRHREKSDEPCPCLGCHFANLAMDSRTGQVVEYDQVKDLVDLARQGQRDTFKDLAACFGVPTDKLDELWDGTVARLKKKPRRGKKSELGGPAHREGGPTWLTYSVDPHSFRRGL